MELPARNPSTIQQPRDDEKTNRGVSAANPLQLGRLRKAVGVVKDRHQLKRDGRNALLFGFEEAAVRSLDYKKQGDLEFYTEENMRKRMQNRNHPDVVAELNMFYNTFMSRLEHPDGYVSQKEGVSVTVRVCKALFDPDDFVLADAVEQSLAEWVREVKDAASEQHASSSPSSSSSSSSSSSTTTTTTSSCSTSSATALEGKGENEAGDGEASPAGFMSKEIFMDSLFETADIWTDDVDPTGAQAGLLKRQYKPLRMHSGVLTGVLVLVLLGYVEFLQKLYRRITCEVPAQEIGEVDVCIECVAFW
jgi:hypothetical protein